METIKQIIRQAGGAAAMVSGTRGRPTLTAGLSSQKIVELKRLFLDVASGVCPGFKVTAYNRGIISDLFHWCSLIPGTLDLGKDLWLYGTVGSGKTTMLKIVRDFCKIVRGEDDKGDPYSFGIDMMSDVCAAYAEKGEAGLRPYIEARRKAFDDLGAETIPAYHYGSPLNVFQRVLEARYGRRHDMVTHITANMSPEQAKEVYGVRVYDRCREMFNFVEFTGPTFRK